MIASKPQHARNAVAAAFSTLTASCFLIRQAD
jgi:hypothetical protein